MRRLEYHNSQFFNLFSHSCVFLYT